MTISGEQSALFRQRLKDRRFWLIQALVVAVTLVHFVVELLHPMDLHGAYFLPASLYLFPVLYASLNFGTSGAIPTAIWSACLAMPNVIFLHHGVEAAGETFQVATMMLLGSVVALRVEKERAARQAAEAAEQERRASEMKYRSLFDGASEAIVVVDSRGMVREANAAAVALVPAAAGDPMNQPLTAMLGSEARAILRTLEGEPVELADIAVDAGDGVELWLEPRLTEVTSGNGVLTQVLLRDVTDRHGFQHYAQEVVKAQERERQWIAQELHDVSVQSAILICRGLDAASDAVEQEQREEILRLLEETRGTAENMADELRRFSRDLRPLILEDLGLVPALKRLPLELQHRTNIRARFNVTGSPRRLDAAVELALFRIAQESVRNVERHSCASTMSLSLALGPEGVRLSITDNGKGFHVPPLTSLLSEGRLGLLGMQERARLVGGRCEVRSTVGRGTRVVAEAPAPSVAAE
ncbi:MAG TPA: sensor histidine kinase [Tepidiformaceae bacterium]|nr:sensor histidine kinase [Tepidiformaceae bacterium]